MGFDDLKIAAITASLFLPVLAQAVQSDMPTWVLTLKELGSVVAVIYLFYYTLTRAIPGMQQRFDASLKTIAVSHAEQLAAERQATADMNRALLQLLQQQLAKGSPENQETP